MDWNAFYDYWNGFIRDWYQSGAQPADPVSQTFRNDSGFTPCWYELPEPYQGRHENCKVVVINYNPGAAGANETVKSYLRRNDSGTLIHKFADEHNCRYSDYQAKWQEVNENLVDHDPEVPGVKWWQERCKWFRRFFNNPELVTSEIFALEMCPYHSRYWTGTIPRALDEHYRQRVLGPAFAAVCTNDLPCVVCVGKKIGIYLCEHLGARTVLVWKNGIGPDHAVLADWPRKDNGNLVKRTYELLEVPVTGWNLGLPVETVKCLVLSAPGSNSLPSANFERVERLIRASM